MKKPNTTVQKTQTRRAGYQKTQSRRAGEQKIHSRGQVSRKIHADLFIDDRNVGGFPGWGEIYQMLTNSAHPVLEKKKGFFGLFK